MMTPRGSMNKTIEGFGSIIDKMINLGVDRVTFFQSRNYGYGENNWKSFDILKGCLNRIKRGDYEIVHKQKKYKIALTEERQGTGGFDEGMSAFIDVVCKT